jgi:hypothetical protein
VVVRYFPGRVVTATTTIHHSLQSRGLPSRAELLAGEAVPAAVISLRLPPSSPEPPRLLLRPQTSPWWSQGPPSPVPRPDSGESSTDLGPDHRRPPRGTQLQGGFLFEGQIAKQGPIRKESQTFGGFLDTWIWNSKRTLLFLVNSLENRRKLGKLQTQFC